MLHDPHQIPEPFLVLTGLSYLAPTYAAYSKKRTYDTLTFLALTCTTIGFHGTRNEFIFCLDCLAILNYLCRGLWLAAQKKETLICYGISVGYSLISYFVGRYYSIMSFHPDWNVQMVYHGLMHLSTAYSSYIVIDVR
jgi:hypothetical protein